MDEEEKAAENDHPSRMASTSLIKSELEDFPLESRLDLGVGVGRNAAFVKNENEIDSEEEYESRKKKSHKKKVFYNPDEYGPEDIFCRKCFKPFISLRGLWSHVTQLKPCRKFYGEDAILEMRESLSALPPVSPNTQALRIAQQRERSRDYFEKHRIEILKKRKRLFNESKAKGDELQKELDNSHCKHCFKPFKNLRGLWSHIAQMVPCRKFYGEEALAEMKQRLAEVHVSPKKLSKSKRLGSDDNDDDDDHDADVVKDVKVEQKITEKKSFRLMQRVEEGRKEVVEPKPRNKRVQDFNENSKKVFVIPDPDAPHGVVNVKLDSNEGESTDTGKPFYSVERQISPLGICHQEDHIPGKSKIDHETATELSTMPVGSKLSSLILSSDDCHFVDSFVAMALSKDGESVEVKYIIKKSDITLSGLRDLLHSVSSVLDIDLFNFLSEKSSPILLSPPEQLPLLRNRFTKETLANGKQKLPAINSVCESGNKNFETHFISDEMLEDVPYHQLLLNPNLALCDVGCIGVQFRRKGEMKIWLAPLFSVNTQNHWRHYARIFFTILVNWVGSKALLTELVHRLPCGITAKNQYFESVKSECWALVQEPREVSICEHCGEQFEFYKYLFSEKNKYKHHVESHKLTCKKCGEIFPNATVRIFHERTHRQNYVPCTKEGCKWVGRSAKSLATHIRIFHTHELCDLCGKEFANSQSLALHMTSYHQPKKPNSWFCEVCGKGYSSKNILDKHVKRHYKENSLVNKWMHDSPNEYKYECTKHNNCKKYFKTEAQFKRHMKTFATRDHLLQNFFPLTDKAYRPDIDPASHNFIRDVPLSAEETEAAAAAQLKRKRKRKGLKEEDEEADKKQKLKKNKNDEYDDDDDDDIATDFVASTSNRTTGFNVEDNLKSTFDNHEYIHGQSKDAVGLESLSRSSSVAPNPPSGLQSPEIVHQRIREVQKLVQEMKDDPDELPHLHYRSAASTAALSSRSHPIFNHLYDQAQQHQSNLPNHQLHQQLQHQQPQHQHDPNLQHWMAMAHHALYNNSGAGTSHSSR